MPLTNDNNIRMRRINILILLLAFVAGVKAQQPTAYDINVGDFNELKVSDGINVNYKFSADSAGRAYFDCPARMVSAFIFTNKGGKLTVQLSPESIGTKDLPDITVCSKFLTKVENNGDSTLRVLSANGVPKFEAILEGNGRLSVKGVDANDVKAVMRLGKGTLVISGQCRDAKLDLTGTGVIQADELVAQNASVSAKGTGSVGVNAVNNLGIFGMGTTSIYYVGSPAIKNRSVGLKLYPLNKD